MLSLVDSRWGELKSTYTDGTRVAELLALAESGLPLDRWYDDLSQELCHQYTISEASYAALPHLVLLARDREEARKHLLVLAGICYACSQLPDAPSIPAGFEQEWHAAAQNALPLLAKVVAEEQHSESDLRYLAMSLAAFNGHYSLGLAIEALDSEVQCPNCGTVFDLAGQVI